MSWIFGRRSVQASKELIQANWDVQFMEDFTKGLDQRSRQIDRLNKLEKVAEAAKYLDENFYEDFRSGTNHEARDALTKSLKELDEATGGEK